MHLVIGPQMACFLASCNWMRVGLHSPEEERHSLVVGPCNLVVGHSILAQGNSVGS